MVYHNITSVVRALAKLFERAIIFLDCSVLGFCEGDMLIYELLVANICIKWDIVFKTYYVLKFVCAISLIKN